MTKTELEIAKYMIDRKEIKIDLCIANNKDFFIKSNFDKKNFRKIALRYLQEDFGYALLLNEMFEHKATCQRWLESLELTSSKYCGCDRCPSCKIFTDKVRNDLIQTIALYVEDGI